MSHEHLCLWGRLLRRPHLSLYLQLCFNLSLFNSLSFCCCCQVKSSVKQSLTHLSLNSPCFVHACTHTHTYTQKKFSFTYTYAHILSYTFTHKEHACLHKHTFSRTRTHTTLLFISKQHLSEPSRKAAYGLAYSLLHNPPPPPNAVSRLPEICSVAMPNHS